MIGYILAEPSGDMSALRRLDVLIREFECACFEIGCTRSEVELDD